MKPICCVELSVYVAQDIGATFEEMHSETTKYKSGDLAGMRKTRSNLN